MSALFVCIGLMSIQIYWSMHMGMVGRTIGWMMMSVAMMTVLGGLMLVLFKLLRQKMLHEVQKDFVSNITHEFKTPLSVIHLSAEVLKDPKIITTPQRLLNYAGIIAQESKHLSSHVEKVFQLSEIESGGLKMKPDTMDWGELLQENVKIFEKIIQEQSGEIKLHLSDSQIDFYGDYFHLNNVISNLIDNAIKYCDNTPVIHIFLKIRRKNLHISVKDNGIGIGKQHQKLLFRKFYRVPTGNVHDVKGVGLGLNYAKFIAKAHGGEIRCSSNLGKGSTFTLVFPIKN
ncbi:sensor histidine kinase [Taibaiella soli]|nr:HAMP domain-containing sensor histidine kinase [Taibaiella soli]